MDRRGEIADKRETKAMSCSDIGFFIEQRLSLTGGNTGAVVGNGEADMMVFFPGPPFDQSVERPWTALMALEVRFRRIVLR